MAYQTPKTPSRRSRSVTKTPLTPSLISGINNVSLASPTKSRTRKGASYTKPITSDVSNPFIQPQSKSRPTSPMKRSMSSGFHISDELSRQASSGVIRKNGPESRMMPITNDYMPIAKAEMKRSKSQPTSIDSRDRFITTRDEDNLVATLDQMHISSTMNTSPNHTARLAAAASLPLNKRVLAYHEAPPMPAANPLLSQQRDIARPLLASTHTRPGAIGNSIGATTNKSRKIAVHPERVLDAPGMVDDFYLNLIAWSCLNMVAVALGESTYLWRAETGEVSLVGEAPEGSYVSSVSFSNDGSFLAIGYGTGEVELWDLPVSSTEGSPRKLRTMAGHQAQIASLSWNNHVLSSGCGDGSIWHHDVRISRHKVMELLGHTGEVCGLSWRSDGELLASGGNDNVVNIWDGRVGDVGDDSRGVAKWSKRNHTAAVKALAWCPWQPALLASGGGTNDATIHVWNTTTGARVHSQTTPAQVTSLVFSPHKKELLSTHGYPTNAIMVHTYPSFEKVAEIRDAHDSRILFSCISPAGDVVCTGAGDENLKFWRIWEVPKPTKKRQEKARSGSGTGILTIR